MNIKNKILTVGIIIFSFNLSAQITITNSDFPNGGDTCLISLSNQFTTVDFATTGVNQVWDFSYLEPNSQRIDTFFNINSSSALYQISFNNWLTAPDYNSDYYNKLINNTLPAIPGGAITLDKPVFFTKNSSSKQEIVGIGVEVNGIEIPVKSDTIDVVYDFPLNFNDSWLSRSYFYMDMNPAYDAQFKRHQQRNVVVDGWGQITTPFGTFDAIRVKTTLTYQDSIYADPFGIGGAWFALPTPETVEYNWLTNNNKVSVLKIITQANVATTIEYRDSEAPIDYTAIEINKENTFKIFPNPATNNITITLDNNTESIVEIIDINGKVIISKTINSILFLDINHLARGVYIIKVSNNTSIKTQPLVIK